MTEPGLLLFLTNETLQSQHEFWLYVHCDLDLEDMMFDLCHVTPFWSLKTIFVSNTIPIQNPSVINIYPKDLCLQRDDYIIY